MSSDAAAGTTSASSGLAPDPQRVPQPQGRSAFVPLLIVIVTAAAWSAFQFYQLRQESTALKSLHANQENLIQQAQRVRQNLDALAAQTKRLADAGNSNARAVVDELARRGITINPPAAASSPQK